MLIEVCGPGCPRCRATKKNVLEAVKEAGLHRDARVVEIKGPSDIGQRGIFITPAVIIDGVKVCGGKVPSAQELKKWIEERR